MLGDLRASIRAGKQTDLDRIAARYVIEQSKDLRLALKRGALRLVQKDNPFGDLTVSTKESNEGKPEEMMDALKQMEKRLIERLNAQVERHATGGKSQDTTALDPSSIDKLNAAIDALQRIAGNGGGAPVQQPQEEEISTDDDEKVVDIHQRSINRLTKGAKSNIAHKKESAESNVDKNIDELEDLL